MMFLKLHQDGKPRLVNLGQAEKIKSGNHTFATGDEMKIREVSSVYQGGGYDVYDETLAEVEEIINHAAGRAGVWGLERVRQDRRRVAEEMIRRSEMTRRRFEEIGIGNHLPEAVPDDVDDEPFNAAAVDRALCRDDDDEPDECPECGGAGDVGMPLGDNADEPLACPRCGGTGTR